MPKIKKHLINDSKALIERYLKSLTYLNDSIRFDKTNNIISLKEIEDDKVHLICGGGSGHEPSHSSFVGPGMLSAAVCGNVFASPNNQQISNALKLLSKSKGILMVVKNYTGDVINFGIAKERYLANNESTTNVDNLRMVIVGDDVSVGREQGKLVGRRGLAGTVLVYKIAGALASKGASLAQVQAVAQYVIDNLATIGVGLDHSKIPGVNSNDADNDLGPEEVEIGMGIHNEPGFKRQNLTDLDTLISDLMKALTSTTDKDRSFLPIRTDDKNNNSLKAKSKTSDESNENKSDNRFIVLINNLGSISELEMGSIVESVGRWLFENGFSVDRVISGKFMTALDMPGFSISLILLPPKTQSVKIRLEEEERGSNNYESIEIDYNMILELFDQPCKTLGWDCSKVSINPQYSIFENNDKEFQSQKDGLGDRLKKKDGLKIAEKPNKKVITVKDQNLFLEAVKSCCEALIESEPEITRLDTILGDGDCGETLKNGARGVLKEISDERIDGNDLVEDLLKISNVVDSQMGGTSGGLYSIFFNSLATGISKFTNGDVAEVSDWNKALDYALNTLYKYTKARPPSSRTLIDPLSSFILSYSLRSTEEFELSILAAKESVECTIYLDSRFGRSSYLDQDRVKSKSNSNNKGSSSGNGNEKVGKNLIEGFFKSINNNKNVKVDDQGGGSLGDRIGGVENLPDPGSWGVWKALEGIGKVLK